MTREKKQGSLERDAFRRIRRWLKRRGKVRRPRSKGDTTPDFVVDDLAVCVCLSVAEDDLKQAAERCAKLSEDFEHLLLISYSFSFLELRERLSSLDIPLDRVTLVDFTDVWPATEYGEDQGK